MNHTKETVVLMSFLIRKVKNNFGGKVDTLKGFTHDNIFFYIEYVYIVQMYYENIYTACFLYLYIYIYMRLY